MPMINIERSARQQGNGCWPFRAAIFFCLLPFGAGPQGAAEGSPIRQLVWGVLFISASIVIARNSERFGLAMKSVPSTLGLLLLYVCASVLWSPDPFVSFKRVVEIIGVVILGASLISGGGGNHRIHRLTTPVLLLTMLLVIVVSGAFPEYAFSDIGFRGFMGTKNNLGQFAVFAIMFAVAYLAIERRHRFVYVLLALAGLISLGLSKSVTAWSALVFAAAFPLTLWLWRRISGGWWQVMFFTGSLISVAVFYYVLIMGPPSFDTFADLIYQFSGKNMSLSGRTDLWGLMWEQFLSHPVLGTGYGGFWLGLSGESGQIAYLVKWGYPGQAHNGYLDILNELGVAGTLLVALFIVEHGVNLARTARINAGFATFHGALLIALLTMNISETVLLRTTHLWWIVFVASVLEVGHMANLAVRVGPLAGANHSRVAVRPTIGVS